LIWTYLHDDRETDSDVDMDDEENEDLVLEMFHRRPAFDVDKNAPLE